MVLFKFKFFDCKSLFENRLNIATCSIDHSNYNSAYSSDLCNKVNSIEVSAMRAVSKCSVGSIWREVRLQITLQLILTNEIDVREDSFNVI